MLTKQQMSTPNGLNSRRGRGSTPSGWGCQWATATGSACASPVAIQIAPLRGCFNAANEIRDRIDETYYSGSEVIGLPFLASFLSRVDKQKPSFPLGFSLFQTSRWVRIGEGDALAAKQIKSECQPVRLYSYCLAHAAP